MSKSRSRDRFEEVGKIFDPLLSARNLGKGPGTLYDHLKVYSKITTPRIKRENPQYAFSKTTRMYESTAQRAADAFPGPGNYD